MIQQGLLDNPDQLLPVGAVLTGLAVFLVARTLLPSPRPKLGLGQGDTFEERRRDVLRRGNSLYAALEPLVDVLAARLVARNEPLLTVLGQQLQAAGERLPWQPAEYLAVRRLEATLMGLGVGVLCYLALWNPIVAGLLGALAAYGFAILLTGEPRRAAQRRLQALKRRLPFFVDLMSLMMEAGASFREALQTGVAELGDNPLGEEFALVLSDTDRGRTRREALEALQQRLDDRDLSELIFAITKGEEMGTPLAQILRNQVDQMRLKRTQQAEREAGEAEVAILFPGFLVMLACILLIVGPFVLQALNQKLASG